jgi:hypothetical protein
MGDPFKGLHNYRFRSGLGKSPHLFQDARGETLLAGKGSLQF